MNMRELILSINSGVLVTWNMDTFGIDDLSVMDHIVSRVEEAAVEGLVSIKEIHKESHTGNGFKDSVTFVKR